jgi:hypothetical protein
MVFQTNDGTYNYINSLSFRLKSEICELETYESIKYSDSYNIQFINVDDLTLTYKINDYYGTIITSQSASYIPLPPTPVYDWVSTLGCYDPTSKIVYTSEPALDVGVVVSHDDELRTLYTDGNFAYNGTYYFSDVNGIITEIYNCLNSSFVAYDGCGSYYPAPVSTYYKDGPFDSVVTKIYTVPYNDLNYIASNTLLYVDFSGDNDFATHYLETNPAGEILYVTEC